MLYGVIIKVQGAVLWQELRQITERYKASKSTENTFISIPQLLALSDPEVL